MQLENKVIVITGAAQGLGAAMALRLGSKGCKIILVDINLDKLQSQKIELTKRGIEAECFSCDISDESKVSELFEQLIVGYSQIDALINNAGIIRDSLLNKPNADGGFDSLSLNQWQSVIDVNLTGVFLCSREVSKHMMATKTKGVIVNISSISRAGNIGQSNYSAAKAGVVALTVTWAKELAKAKIRVGAIAPGFIGTEMTQQIKPEILKHIAASVPLGRMGDADEIAHGVEFILENDYFSGRVLEIDGGLRI